MEMRKDTELKNSGYEKEEEGKDQGYIPTTDQEDLQNMNQQQEITGESSILLSKSELDTILIDKKKQGERALCEVFIQSLYLGFDFPESINHYKSIFQRDLSTRMEMDFNSIESEFNQKSQITTKNEYQEKVTLKKLKDEYEGGIVSQIFALINPDPDQKGGFSIHEELPLEFTAQPFNEEDYREKVDSLTVPDDFDSLPVILKYKDLLRNGQNQSKEGDYKNSQYFVMLAQFANLIYPEFEYQMTATMRGLNLKVTCGIKFSTKNREYYEYWLDPRFLRIVDKQLNGDNHYTLADDLQTYLFNQCNNAGQIRIHAKDTLRSTTFVQSPGQIHEVIMLLQQKFTVKEIKNKLYDKNAAYSSVYVIFVFQGLLAEMQLIPISNQNDKNSHLNKKVCHALYEILRGNAGPYLTLQTIIQASFNFLDQ